jgi:phosphatidylglycerophosphatase A
MERGLPQREPSPRRGARTGIGLAAATCLGLGYVPVAPGTAGSAAALPLAWWAHRAAGVLGVAACVVVAVVVGTWAAREAERHYGVHDSPHIVVDELAGQLLSAIPVPCTWWNLLLAFGWFRLFDSVKPWPAGWIDRNVQGGVGVMADDLAAAVYAGAATAVMVYSSAWDQVLTWIARAV